MQNQMIKIPVFIIALTIFLFAAGALAQDESDGDKTGEQKSDAAVETPEVPREFASVEEYMKNLEDQRRAIERERQALIALRTEVRTDIERLLKLQKDIDARLKVEDEAQEAKIKKLVSIYSKMKPAQVVPLLNNLDEELRLRVIYSMKSKDQASILALMSPEKAAAITQKIMKKDF